MSRLTLTPLAAVFALGCATIGILCVAVAARAELSPVQAPEPAAGPQRGILTPSQAIIQLLPAAPP